MKASDLRIGNLLRDKVSKTELRVVKLGDDGSIVTHVIDRTMFPLKDGWGIEPIPLTREKLIDLGFEECGYEALAWQHPKIPGFQFAGINWADAEFPEYQFLNYQVGDSIFRIDYVHELQNICFALAKEELIKQEEQ